MADNSTRIAELEEILRIGMTGHTNDGTSSSHDLGTVRSELRKLRADDDTQKGRRPGVVSIDLSGF